MDTPDIRQTPDPSLFRTTLHGVTYPFFEAEDGDSVWASGHVDVDTLRESYREYMKVTVDPPDDEYPTADMFTHEWAYQQTHPDGDATMIPCDEGDDCAAPVTVGRW